MTKKVSLDEALERKMFLFFGASDVKKRQVEGLKKILETETFVKMNPHPEPEPEPEPESDIEPEPPAEIDSDAAEEYSDIETYVYFDYSKLLPESVRLAQERSKAAARSPDRFTRTNATIRLNGYPWKKK